MADQVSARGAATDANGATTDALSTARDALENHRWQEAYEEYAAADKAGPLSGDDLETYALTAYFAARPDVVTDAMERAFKAHQAAGDRGKAARIALILARDLYHQGKPSISAAWVKRAERVLEGTEGTAAHGYLALARSLEAIAAGDIERAMALADEGARIGAATGDADLEAVGLADPRRPEDREGRGPRRPIADGRSDDRGRERRAVPVHHGRDVLPDDRRLSRPDGLPPRQRMDRGHRTLVRAPVRLGFPGRLPHPSG